MLIGCGVKMDNKGQGGGGLTQGAAAPAVTEKRELTSLEVLMSPAHLEAARPHQGQTQEAPCGLPLKG